MATIYVRVHRAWTGDYWTEVVGDVDATVGVSVTHYGEDDAHEDPEAGEVVYMNDAAIDLWEQYHLAGGPDPLKLGEPVIEDVTVSGEVL